MSFMNAKEARPVDDPKALVPFGWAPGGYHCAACSACGEAHGGSDKRSMRCQDCAEALRDKQAAEHAPTTRETADHAELARLADDPAMDFGGFGRGRVKTLQSEIAALRGEMNTLYADMAAEIHEAHRKRTQAERQRDELRKALGDVLFVRKDNPKASDRWMLEEIHRISRIAIANQGADQ